MSTTLPTQAAYPSPFTSEADLYETVTYRYARYTTYRVPAPPVPPVGTVVRNRFGTRLVRMVDKFGTDGWQSYPVKPGRLSSGEWAYMWRCQGPLTVD